MFRAVCIAFLILFAALPTARAQESAALVLTETSAAIDMTPYLYMTDDPARELSAQDLVQRFKNNIRGKRHEGGPVRLPLAAPPQWIAIEIKNETERAEWAIDFGSFSEGRAGTLSRLLIYEGTARTIYFNGLGGQDADETATSMAGGRLVPVTLAPGQTAILIFYLVPGDHAPLVLSPSLRSLHDIVNSQPTGGMRLETLVPFALAAGLLLMLTGFIYNQSPGFIPFIFFYAFALFCFFYLDLPVFPSITEGETLAAIALIMKGLLILAGCYLTIPYKGEVDSLRIVVIVTIALNIIAMIAVAVMIPAGSPVRAWTGYAFFGIDLIVGLLFLCLHADDKNRTPVLFLAGWIGLLTLGYGLRIIGLYTSSMSYPAFIQAHYYILFPQVALVIGGIVAVVHADSREQVMAVIRKAKKAQTLLKARQSKEAADQSRLLRVIEREREIMEELRGRESERTEEMRRAKIIADEANNAKSAFLAVVSHEIRTPMTGIMGMVRLLEETDLSREQRDYANTIKDSGDAMLALLNDILDFSKIESGGLDLETIDFDLHRVLNGVIMLMRGHAEQKNVALRLEIDADIPQILRGDPTRLRQIFLNLVGNALKFTERGYVAIRAVPDIGHKGHDPDHGRFAITYSVEDTGIGISEEAQARLFTPFAQADTSIARKYGGTGLGLAICRRLVEAMGSSIRLASQEGKGTTFSFTVVTEEGNHPDTAASRPPRTQASVKPLHVLVVDDNAINRKVVAGLLARDGHTADYADCGTRAIAMATEEKARYDVILMDIEMPDINGVDATQKIFETAGDGAPPIIALTGNVSDTDVAAYRQNGFYACLPKPIDPDGMRTLMNRIALSKAGATPADAGQDDEDTFAAALALEEQAGEQSPPDQAAPRDDAKPLRHVGRLIDEDMLKGLKDGLGVPQTRELIVGLFEKTDEIIPQMQDAYARDDRETLRARAHELKGMAGNFGLVGLSEKASIIERICKNDDSVIGDAKDHLDILLSVTERSKLAVSQYLDNG